MSTLTPRPGAHIELSFRPGAERRTKNRIAEHGMQGFLVQEVAHTRWWRGLAVHLRAVGSDWFGWLPLDDVDVVEIRP